jgi:ABC-2 type transport system ATP-binding protein
MNEIEVESLTKRFGQLVAVDQISFAVERGEVFGLLGLNGAGKTTTVMMLSTLLNPTSGSATVCGYDIVRNREGVRESIGLVFEEQAVDIYLTGKENLDFHARMYHIPKKVREERVAEVLDLVRLRDSANVRVKDYSGGMVRRLEIARGMLNYPRVLFLDEPTIGLDVQTRRFLWDYVTGLNRESGMTVLLTTSFLEEADYLCSRIAIIDRGKLVATGTPQELKDSIGGGLLSLKLSQGSNEDFMKLLRGLDWGKKIEERNGSLELSVMGREVGIPELVRFARGNGFTIASISSHKPSLDDVLLHYTGRRAEEGEETTRKGKKTGMGF